MSLRLRHSPLSPFVRKVVVFAHELGVIDRITFVPTDVWDPNSDIATDNPLGKVPALITDEGSFSGSLLCCEYLQTQKVEPALIPASAKARLAVLQLHAIADGMLEAAVVHVVERFRRPKQAIFEDNLKRQEQKIENALAYLEARSAALTGCIDIACITAGCALEYLDFRMSHLDWRARAQRLATWQTSFSTRPSFMSTRPNPQPN